MQYDHNSLGIVNHDYPAFLNDPAIQKIAQNFARYSALEKFYLVGGFVVDRLFYPETASHDVDLQVFGYELFDQTIKNLALSGTVHYTGTMKRNLVSSGKRIVFTANDQEYDIGFLPAPMFVAQYSPECPMIEYPSGRLIEQGPNIKAHREKTIEIIRPIEIENKQNMLMRFIHTVCKYDFPLDSRQNQKTLSTLRESFEHRDPKELILQEAADKQIIDKIKTASARPNQRWLEVKDNLAMLQFNKVLSAPVWKAVLSY